MMNQTKPNLSSHMNMKVLTIWLELSGKVTLSLVPSLTP
jgi:hypothetical protein